jgi:hypothetical protein
MITNAALTVKPHDSYSTNLTFAQINNGNAIGISTSNSSGTANWDTCIQPFGGKVGIGTETPSDTLVVKNDSSSVNPILVIKNDNATDDNGVSIDFSGKDTSNNNIIFGRIAFKYTNHATEKSELQISHRNDSGALDQQVTLDHDGNLGIGTAGPARTLHVNSGAINEVARLESSDTAVKIEFKDSTGTATLETRNDFRFSNSNSELVRFKDNGFVGIGTDNPIELLYLKSTSDDARLTIDAASGYDPEIKLYENGAVKQTVGYDSASSEFRIGTTNVDTGVGMAIDSSRNVSIPNGELSVNGAAEAKSFRGTGGFGSSTQGSTFGETFAKGVITSNSTTVSVNLNGAGGNQSIGFIAVSLVPSGTASKGSIALYSHGHSQSSNQYTSLFEQNDDAANVGTVSNSGGALTIVSGSNMVSSHTQVYYSVRVINILDYFATVNQLD